MPEIHIAYSQRGYCTKAGYRRLEQVLEDCRALYNAALQERRDAWRMNSVNVSWVDQNRSLTAIRAEWPDREGAVDRRVQREVLRRVERAYQAFFRRVRTGQTPGFPRFQSHRRYRTIEVEAPTKAMLKVRGDGLKVWVKVKGLPCVQLRSSRPLPSARHLKTLRIVWKPTGIWVDLGFRVEREALPENEAAVGVHMGVRNRMTLSAGELVDRRQVDRSRENRLRQALERSTKRDTLGRLSGPQSNRRAKRLKMLSRETERNARRNRNACHELTTAIVRQYGRIAVEKLNIRDMTRRSGSEASASEIRVQGDTNSPADGGGSGDYGAALPNNYYDQSQPVVSVQDGDDDTHNSIGSLEPDVSNGDGASRDTYRTSKQAGGNPEHDGAADSNWQIGFPAQHDGAATARNMYAPADGGYLTSSSQASGSAHGAGTRNLNRDIMAQTWGLILGQLRYKAEWTRREFVEVDPANVSQVCSSCGLVSER